MAAGTDTFISYTCEFIVWTSTRYLAYIPTFSFFCGGGAIPKTGSNTCLFSLKIRYMLKSSEKHTTRPTWWPNGNRTCFWRIRPRVFYALFFYVMKWTLFALAVQGYILWTVFNCFYFCFFCWTIGLEFISLFNQYAFARYALRLINSVMDRGVRFFLAFRVSLSFKKNRTGYTCFRLLP